MTLTSVMTSVPSCHLTLSDRERTIM